MYNYKQDVKGVLNNRYVAWAIAIFIILIVWKFWSKISVKIDSFFDKKETEIPLDDKPVAKPTATKLITDKQAEQYANDLHIAMKDLGTDDDKVRQIFVNLMNSPKSLIKVYNAFGKKPYFRYGDPSQIDLLLSNYDKLDLKSWLSAEIPEERYKQWDALFRKAGYS